jgi:hypothetical protein
MALFRRGRAPAAGARVLGTSVLLEGQVRVEAVGESFYQPTLLAVCGARRGEAVGHECTALLVLEPENPHDPNAVRIEVEGHLVGHLSRADALAYRATLQAAAAAGRAVACPAWIAGRGTGGETVNLGIFLHLPSPGAALARFRAR